MCCSPSPPLTRRRACRRFSIATETSDIESIELPAVYPGMSAPAVIATAAAEVSVIGRRSAGTSMLRLSALAVTGASILS